MVNDAEVADVPPAVAVMVNELLDVSILSGVPERAHVDVLILSQEGTVPLRVQFETVAPETLKVGVKLKESKATPD